MATLERAPSALQAVGLDTAAAQAHSYALWVIPAYYVITDGAAAAARQAKVSRLEEPR